MSNALKFSNENSEIIMNCEIIEVKLKEDVKTVKISVIDFGIGILEVD